MTIDILAAASPRTKGCRTFSVYALEGEPLDLPDTLPDLTLEHLPLGGSSNRYRRAGMQVPRLVACERLEELKLAEESAGDPLGQYTHGDGRLMVFVVSHRAVVLALEVEVESQDRYGRIQFLRDATFRKLRLEIGGRPLIEAAAAVAPAPIAQALPGMEVGRVHQIIAEHDVRAYARTDGDPFDLPAEVDLTPRGTFELDERYIDALVNLAPDDVRAGRSRVAYPGELNHDLGGFTAVTDSATVAGGQGDDIVNAMLLSAVQCVASATSAVRIREDAYRELVLFRELPALPSRAQLATTSDHLRHLRLDLAFGVEAYLDISLLLPHFRVAGYHRTLAALIRLPEGAAAIGALLDQLAKAIAAALATVERDERDAEESRRQADDRRRTLDDRRSRELAAIASVLATVAVPCTLLLAFLGINGREVSDERSILSSSYWPYYALILLVCVAAFAAAVWRERSRTAADLAGEDPPTTTGAGDAPSSVASTGLRTAPGRSDGRSGRSSPVG